MRSDLLIIGVGIIIAVILLVYVVPLIHIDNQSSTYANINYMCSNFGSLGTLAQVLSGQDTIGLCARSNQIVNLGYVFMVIGGILLVAGLFLKKEIKLKKT